MMMNLLNTLIQISIEAVVTIQKFQHTPNPLSYRMLLLLEELQLHACSALSHGDITNEGLQEDLTIIYRDAVELDEMNRMMNKISPIGVETEIDGIITALVRLVPCVVIHFGWEKSIYLIPPSFQQQSKLWT
ncbi:hypothetical protein [Paenibacillus macerans]|uniref:hypothetical protein n=1 Tax=Paenibacillus macerans TaxID=44252 RepID=UPI003D31C412